MFFSQKALASRRVLFTLELVLLLRSLQPDQPLCVYISRFAAWKSHMSSFIFSRKVGAYVNGAEKYYT